MRLRALAAAALLTGCATTQRLPGGSERILLTGRVAPGPALVWGGTRAALRFSGTQITATLREAPSPEFEARLRYKNKYRFLLDGKQVAEVLAAPAADGRWSWTSPEVPQGEHLFELVKETEAGVGESTLVELLVRGRAKEPPARPARRLEFIGDSHAAGFGALGKEPCPFGSETESHSQAFAAAAADLLSAEGHFVVWSGRGLTRNYDAERPPETVPQMWRRTLPHRPPGWSPDAVVIVVGANDFGPGDPGPGFIDAFEAFLREVHATYPKAWVLALGRAHKPALSAYLQEAVEKRLAAEAWVRFLELPRHTPEEGKGCVGHATVPTQRRHGRMVAEAIGAALGWN